MELITPFNPMYARNHKSKTKKNMRCFPHCNLGGHSKRGFCGNAVRVRVSAEMKDAGGLAIASGSAGAFQMYGGIRCDREKPWCKVGGVLAGSTIEQLIVDNHLIKGKESEKSEEIGSWSHLQTTEFIISPGLRKGKCRKHPPWGGLFFSDRVYTPPHPSPLPLFGSAGWTYTYNTNSICGTVEHSFWVFGFRTTAQEGVLECVSACW
jgi:hypothetical protein